MNSTIFQTSIGVNEIGYFVGDGENRIQFSQDQVEALSFAATHSQDLSDAFVNFCSTTFASGEIPSCFRQDLSVKEISEAKEDLVRFQNNFRDAIFNLMLILEF
jgi:hypothetical protein